MRPVIWRRWRWGGEEEGRREIWGVQCDFPCTPTAWWGAVGVRQRSGEGEGVEWRKEGREWRVEGMQGMVGWSSESLSNYGGGRQWWRRGKGQLVEKMGNKRGRVRDNRRWGIREKKKDRTKKYKSERTGKEKNRGSEGGKDKSEGVKLMNKRREWWKYLNNGLSLLHINIMIFVSKMKYAATFFVFFYQLQWERSMAMILLRKKVKKEKIRAAAAVPVPSKAKVYVESRNKINLERALMAHLFRKCLRRPEK